MFLEFILDKSGLAVHSNWVNFEVDMPFFVTIPLAVVVLRVRKVYFK